MRILHTVEFYSPSVGGAQEVVRRISEALARRGHEVVVATTKDPTRTFRDLHGVWVEEFEVSGNAVRGIVGEVDRYRRFVLDGQWDIVMTYAAQQWTMDALLPIVEQIRAARVLAPCGFSGLLNSAYKDYFDELRIALHRYDHLVFHSNSYQDIEFAREANVERYTVVANAAEPREFAQADGAAFRRRHGIGQDTPLLLTVGSHTGLKGHSLVLETVRRARLPTAAVVLVGNTVHGRGCLWNCRARALALRVGSRNRKRAVLVDPPRDEVAAAYCAADLFLLGSEIECSPLVLYEAMAGATPFISVDCGNAAEIAEWGSAGIVIPSPRREDGRVRGDADEMAREVEHLLADSDARAKMAEAGRAAVAARFNWGAIVDEYLRVYASAIEFATARR